MSRECRHISESVQLKPARPVSLTDARMKEPAGNMFEDDSVICPMIPARFTPLMSVTTWRQTTRARILPSSGMVSLRWPNASCPDGPLWAERPKFEPTELCPPPASWESTAERASSAAWKSTRSIAVRAMPVPATVTASIV